MASVGSSLGIAKSRHGAYTGCRGEFSLQDPVADLDEWQCNDCGTVVKVTGMERLMANEPQKQYLRTTVTEPNRVNVRSGCTCDIGDHDLLVHEGDCPRRCTFWQRDHHSEQVAQCERPVGHDGGHRLNLYQGSPSRRRERGAAWPMSEPSCSEPAKLRPLLCPYYYLDPDNRCMLQAGHREHHMLTSGVTNAENAP